jgi:hypothetical protein
MVNDILEQWVDLTPITTIIVHKLKDKNYTGDKYRKATKKVFAQSISCFCQKVVSYRYTSPFASFPVALFIKTDEALARVANTPNKGSVLQDW